MAELQGQRFSSPSRIRVDELLQMYDGVIPAVEEELRNSGISAEVPEPGRPQDIDHVIVFCENGDPASVQDLTIVSDVQIGQLLTYFTNWTSYVQGKVTTAEATRDLLKIKAKTLEKALIVTYQEEDRGLSDARAKAAIVLDPRMAKVEAALMSSIQLTKHLTARYDQLRRASNAGSREQTRRQTELEQQTRAEYGHRSPSPGRVPRKGGRFS